MNVANLQLEGLIMAVAAINKVLVGKGLLSTEEIDAALKRTEASLTGEERAFEGLTPSSRDAVCFPIRVLQIANAAQADGELPAFSALTRMVGQTKSHYNDQM